MALENILVSGIFGLRKYNNLNWIIKYNIYFNFIYVSNPVGAMLLSYISGSLHFIPEGHIGIYTRGGALLTGITEPGQHLTFPLITKVYEVQVTLQTDQVTNIPVY